MICLTGDIHHATLRTGNQRHSDISEIETARRYMEILGAAGVKATLFISGKCFAEEWEELRPICEDPLVEIGGHGWDCFEHELWHRICKKLLGSYNGPAWYQRRDARRTIDIIERRTGKRIRAWRNHMYMHGRHTESVLSECGIQLCSDGVARDCQGLVPHPSGLFNFPINIIPDHEHLYHAERTREWVERWQKRYAWRDDFGPYSYEIDDWAEIVLEGLRRNEERGRLSNVLIHPITMYLCDRFAALERIIDYVASCETVFVSEVLARHLAVHPRTRRPRPTVDACCDPADTSR